jgi:hypothetical protein
MKENNKRDNNVGKHIKQEKASEMMRPWWSAVLATTTERLRLRGLRSNPYQVEGFKLERAKLLRSENENRSGKIASHIRCEGFPRPWTS